MAAKATYSRPIRIAADGYFIQRPTTVSSMAVVAGQGDVRVDFYDGSPGGAIIWTIEADNADSSPQHIFDPPMIFKDKVYGKFTCDAPAANYCAEITVLEPAEAEL